MKVLVISADRTTASGGAQNIGDAFLTDCLTSHIGTLGYSCEAVDLSGKTRRTAGRREINSIWALWRAIVRSDKIIVGGGTLIADDQPDRLFAGLPRLCLTASLLAFLAGTDLSFFAVGCDPMSRRRVIWAFRLALFRRDVWARDSNSQGRLLSLLGVRSRVAADAALLYRGHLLSSVMPAERRGAVLALNRREATVLTVSLVKQLRKNFGEVTFIAMDQGDNNDAAALNHAIVDNLDLVLSDCDWPTIFSRIGSAEVVIASRMHGLYMAGLAGTPAVAVGFAKKVASYAAEFSIPLVENLSGEKVYGALPNQQALSAAQDRLHTASWVMLQGRG